MYQNKMDVIMYATAVNNGSELTDVVFKITSEPKFFDDIECRYDSVLPGQYVDIMKHPSFKLNLDANKISSKTESEISNVVITAVSEGQILNSEQCEVRILPYDYWPGAEMPELVSAFITPNATGISKIRSDASEILKSWGVSSSLEGYQGDNGRVLSMGAAVYAALEKYNINYVNPPTGFEVNGQRIRIPDDSLKNHEGTCIDLAVLYASVLESIGLHPVIFFTKGHAFTGFWLIDDCSADIISYDSASYTQHIRNEEMRAVECTQFTSGSHDNFENACESALRKLEDSDNFVCAIDVFRSRSTIRPLPLEKNINGEWAIIREDEDVFTTKPLEPGKLYYNDVKTKNLTKDDIWKRDLLDVSTRNTLIKMKGSKIVPLLIKNISNFEDELADGGSFDLLSKPQEWDGTSVYNEKPFETKLYIMNYENAYEGDIQHHRIRVPLTDMEAEKSLRSIFRASNKELDESGCNSLFIALGTLRWYEKKGTVPHYAPLILIPVQIIKKQAGFTLKKLDEETVFNVTMMEKLRQEFEINIPNLDPLPTEEHGVNVDMILQLVRRGIAGKEKWDVLESAVLGVFSFSQYAMWKDIDTNISELSKNMIVDCFMNSKPYPMTREFDTSSDPYGLCLTVSADSSQIRAVRAAGLGKTFVMHGPPGTGKSQTITNIITNALFNNRTVLFVAEKSEALHVVQKRLNSVGIGSHCLELHSNKTEKGKVLEQLKKALDYNCSFDESKQRETYSRLTSISKKLDSYASDLHKEQSWGLSLYDCISRYEFHNVEGTVDLQIDQGCIPSFSIEKLKEVKDHIQNAYTAYFYVKNLEESPLSAVHMANAYSSVESDVLKHLRDTAGVAKEYVDICEKLRSYDLPINLFDQESVSAFFEKVSSIDKEALNYPDLKQIPGLVNEWVSKINKLQNTIGRWGMLKYSIPVDSIQDCIGSVKDIEPILNRLISVGLINSESDVCVCLNALPLFCATYLRIKDDMDLILGTWTLDVFELNKKWNIAKNWVKSNNAGFFSKGKLRREFMNEISPYVRNPTVLFEELSDTVNLIGGISNDILKLDGFLTNYDSIYAPALRKMSEELQEIIKKIDSNLSKLKDVGLTVEELPGVCERVEKARSFPDEYSKISSAWRTHIDGLTDELALDKRYTPEDFLIFESSVEPYMKNLFNWVNWNHCINEITKFGFGSDTINAIKDGMDSDLLIHSIYRTIYKSMIELCRKNSNSISLFNASTFEDQIREFKQLDAAYMENNKELLKNKLSRSIPTNMDDTLPREEFNTLHRAINAKNIRISLRKLLSQIPNMLMRICPCMLMSPQSVAQYLPMNFQKFDIVVFDESSQLTTCKAIGALGRARSAVIAGDSNQLPPTNFFHRASNFSNDDEDDISDMESFLDECLSLNMPDTYLEWHYRSKHESLITFSNRMFYDSKMLTFPSPNDQDTRVRLEYVAGIYEMKASRNKTEADKIVDEIYRRVMDNQLVKHSIGVIAFSTKQQNCINDILDDRIHEHPDFSRRLSMLKEKLFIKNLETVQGDERDVILFSICYGPTKDGVMRQNFGPLNREGGERRLNVAVSRAREEMIVYSSIKNTDIKITPTSKSGVRSLKEFLKFAENNGHFSENDHLTFGSGQSAILREIKDVLTEEGYDSYYDIGTSEFKVDVAVVNPDSPNEYLLGILTDGDSYKNSNNTRDREYARADVLRNLGWNITHVWSMEWIFNRENAVKKLLDSIEDAKEAFRNRQEEPVEEPEFISEITDEFEDSDGEDDISAVSTDEEDIRFCGCEDRPADITISQYDGTSTSAVPSHVVSIPPSEHRQYYEPMNVEVHYIDTEQALDRSDIIRDLADSIISAESVVTEEYLLKSVATMINIRRLSEIRRSRIRNMLNSFNKVQNGEFITYWDSNIDLESYNLYRVNRDGSIRDIENVPLPEIINAIIDTVEIHGPLTRNDCVSRVAHTFGYLRAKAKVSSFVEAALDIALKHGCVTEEYDIIMSADAHPSVEYQDL